MKKKGILFICLLSIVLMAAPPRMEGAENIIKVGLVLPLTGAGAPWGLCCQRTYQLQAEQYNAAGGIQVGGEKYKIEIVSGDDKYIPSEAVNVVNKLIFKDKVNFLVGPIASAGVLAVAPITQPNKIVSFILCYTHKSLGPDKPYNFRAGPTGGEINPAMFRWVKKTYPHLKKAALIGPNDESGWDVLAEYKGTSKKIGFEIVSEEYFERNTSDYYPILTRLLSSKPEIILIDSGTGDLGLILKQAKQMGFKGLTLTSNPHDPDKLCKVAGQEGAEGHIHSSPFMATEGAKKCKDEFVARWKYWDIMALGFADGLDWLIAGIQKADSLDPDKVKVGLETVNYVSRVWGPIKLGGVPRYGIAHILLSPIAISQIKNCENVGLALAPGEEGPPPPPERKK